MSFIGYIMVVTVFSVVQSVFGMGLLVFGTPTLLLLGANYSDILSILLPSSVILSCLQIWGDKERAASHVSLRQIACPVPFIALGLVASLAGWITMKLELLVAMMLFIGALIRLSARTQELVYVWMRKRQFFYLAGMGLLHGLSNMGGSLLTIYASSVADEKSAIRHVIARFYLVFGVTQLCVLMALNPSQLTVLKLALIPFAVLSHVFVGGKIYAYASNRMYQKALSIFIGMYGVSLLVKNVTLN